MGALVRGGEWWWWWWGAGLHYPQEALNVASYPGESSSLLTFRLRVVAFSMPLHSPSSFLQVL